MRLFRPSSIGAEIESKRSQMPGLFTLIGADLRQKALWCYESTNWKAILKVLVTDGTMAMILYRLMQCSRRYHLLPLEMLFNKLNVICCNCIIGRGAEFGSGLVLIHSTGVVINGKVRGGRNVHIEHQVTIGAERNQSPILGDDIFIGAGAKIVGPVTVGSHARIGANAVVLKNVPADSTAVGIPARIVRRRSTTRNGDPRHGLLVPETELADVGRQLSPSSPDT
jgi:serine O-acetyltransferase